MKLTLLIMLALAAPAPAAPAAKAAPLLICSARAGSWRWSTAQRVVTDAEAAVIIDAFGLKVPGDSKCQRPLCQRIGKHLVCAGHE